MEVSGYTMELYCDQQNPEHKYDEFPHEFYSQTRGECARQARAYGWTFHKNGDMSCPKCSGKRKGSD